jgi:hypothetical protein
VGFEDCLDLCFDLGLGCGCHYFTHSISVKPLC